MELTSDILQEEIMFLLRNFDNGATQIPAAKKAHAQLLHSTPAYRDLQLIAIASGMDTPDDATCIALQMGFELGMMVSSRLWEAKMIEEEEVHK